MFFRHGADSEKRAPVRTRGTNEAQLKELRAKARRRLIGALALVLAAVIVVPWLFQEPVRDDLKAPVVVPATPAGLPPVAASASGSSSPADSVASSGTITAPAPGEGTSAAQGPMQPPQPPQPVAPSGSQQPSGAVSETSAPQPPVHDSEPAAAKPAPRTPATEERAAEPAPTPKPAKKPAGRTDDGSVALALLAGKAPAKSAAPAKAASGAGRYFLQVAAYTTEQDAQSRRGSLRQAGVTDAYVEKGQSAGRTVYRLRVGPFESHEAAQAAQARLRALGYQNGLISAN